MLYWSLLERFSAAFMPGGMAESVDAVDLKSADRKVVGVQVSLPPLTLAPQSLRLSSNNLTLNRFYLLKICSLRRITQARAGVNQVHTYPN
jgi:hypothetical protein